jgi:two-component system, NtrC family, response regulator GlrR
MDHNNKPNSPSSRVLLVDDDPQLLAVMSLRLAEIGCHCTACGNASEAMIQFAANSFDLVITDMSMPGIDGLSVVAMIRSQSAIPILVMTGHSVEYGALIGGYKNVTLLRKPLEARVLIACVRSFLSGKVVSDVQLKCG